MRNSALSNGLLALAVSFAAPANAGIGANREPVLITKPETPSNEAPESSPIDFDAIQKTEAMTIATASSTKCCASGTCDITTNGPDMCWAWATHGYWWEVQTYCQ